MISTPLTKTVEFLIKVLWYFLITSFINLARRVFFIIRDCNWKLRRNNSGHISFVEPDQVFKIAAETDLVFFIFFMSQLSQREKVFGKPSFLHLVEADNDNFKPTEATLVSVKLTLRMLIIIVTLFGMENELNWF